ncbi:FAD/FMN-containing dehydrogenase [Pseudomonas sp. F1_0610]|uniref:FAD/FMN-containing dehydrogenase n=1 Tax=Pseudomonas sp. F1_0610 TaxID=3114284 RepID=UPI0039C3704D
MRKIVILCALFLPILAQAVEVGERLTPWLLKDQFDHGYRLNAKTQLLLIARNMDQAKLVQQALADKPKHYLEQKNAIFVADVSRMPKMISKIFALPAMRKYNYRVMLDLDGAIVSQYTRSDATVIYWLELQQGVVVQEKLFSDAKALSVALDAFK